MNHPLVSVITPTWKRRDLLVKRALPSVAAQDYPNIEHIVVSDGPDPILAELLERPAHPDVYYFELPEHDPERHWGAPARRLGIEKCGGEYIGYIDDDDSLRPDHVSNLVRALEENPQAGFTRSWMASHGPARNVSVIGPGAPAFGNIGTPMILHRRELLQIAHWCTSPGEDFELVRAWLEAGIPWVPVDRVTVDVWPSIYHEH